MNTTKRPARIAVLTAVTSALVAASFGSPLVASAGTGTPAGTSIVNQATSTYSDTANNNYTSTSNKVTTVVQSAPSLTVVDTNALTTVPGGQLTDIFTLTNTGNGSAAFSLSTTGQSGSDGTFASVAAYVVTYTSAFGAPTQTGCTVISATSESCSSLANANALLANNPVASSAVATIGVVYNVSTGATAGSIAAPQTVVTNLSATTSQTPTNNPGTSATATSTSQTANQTDAVVSDARIDLQKFSVQPNIGANTTPNIMYTINAANGGSVPARDLQSVKTLLGGSAPAGIFISDKIPSYSGVLATVQSASVVTSAANGFGGTTTGFYYTTSPTGAGPWTAYSGTGALPSTATFIGVLVSGTPLAELGTNGNSTSTGVVSAAKAAVAFTFYVSPPTGTGSSNPNAYINQADGLVGGGQPNTNPDTPAVANPPQNVIGPNIPVNTADSTTAIDSGTQGILFPTPTSPGNASQPNSSNAVANNATASGLVLDGPYGFPGATGSYNGVVAASNNNDYTAVSFTPSGFVPTNTAASGPPVGNALGSIATVNVPNTVQNIGNGTDNLTVSITAPTGYGVQIFAAGASGAPTGVALAGSTTTNTASYTFVGVPSGLTTDTANQVSYVAVYTVPATALAFAPIDAVNTVASASTPAQTNTTHNDLVPGGPIALSKSVAFDTATCTGGVAVPGCILTYSISYLNNANAASACPATPPTAASIPVYQAGYYAKNFIVTENGTAAPNTWGASYTNSAGTFKNTTGLNAPATDTTAGSAFTTNTTGSYSFADYVGGSAANYVIAPGCSGTLSFKVTVNTQ